MLIEECFEVLGIQSGTNWNDIRNGYRKQIKQWHPDRFQYDDKLFKIANEKTKILNYAYKTLAEHYKIKDKNLNEISIEIPQIDQISFVSNKKSNYRWMGFNDPPPSCEDYGISPDEYRKYSDHYDKEHWRYIITLISIPTSLLIFKNYVADKGLIILLQGVLIGAIVGICVYTLMSALVFIISRFHSKYEEIKKYKNDLKNWRKRQDKTFWDNINASTKNMHNFILLTILRLPCN